MSLIISDFSSLNFRHDWKRDFQVDACYVQKFSTTDRITVQYSTPLLGLVGGLRLVLTNNTTHTPIELTPILIGLNAPSIVYQLDIADLSVGNYTFELRSKFSDEVLAYSIFEVCETLADTVSFKYTNYRDEFGVIFNAPFQFRVEGGFLPSEMLSMVDSESFRNQRGGATQLSALPYETQLLTIGDGLGVPNWVARKLNLIFSISSIQINGDICVRSDGAVPEIYPLHPNYPMFVYKLEVEREHSLGVVVDDPSFPVVTSDGSQVITYDGLQVYSYKNKI